MMTKETPNLYPVEYDWLGPDLTQNTWGQYIPILPVLVFILTSIGHN